MNVLSYRNKKFGTDQTLILFSKTQQRKSQNTNAQNLQELD
jgi:hypothetical protein